MNVDNRNQKGPWKVLQILTMPEVRVRVHRAVGRFDGLGHSYSPEIKTVDVDKAIVLLADQGWRDYGKGPRNAQDLARRIIAGYLCMAGVAAWRYGLPRVAASEIYSLRQQLTKGIKPPKRLYAGGRGWRNRAGTNDEC